jgi:hypothetical protein
MHVIQEEHNTRPSSPLTLTATHHHNYDHNFLCMKMDFYQWDEDDLFGWVSIAKRFFHYVIKIRDHSGCI